MNEALELEMVDLGDAAEQTRGYTSGFPVELNDVAPYKQQP